MIRINYPISDWRKAELNDIYWKFHSDDFAIPSLVNTLTHRIAIDNDDNNIVAFGMIKLYPEAIVVLNKDKSLRVRTEAWRKLMNIAVEECRKAKFTEMHATIHDENYFALLKKHYGFEELVGKHILMEL